MKKRLKKKGKINGKLLILSFVAVYASAFIGSLLTTSAVNSSWYQSVKPSITPPNWVFPLAWNILFFMIFVSLYLSLVSVKKKSLRLELKIAFGVNLLLNILWSFFYFFLKKPNFAFFELILFWLSIIAMIYTTSKINKKSAWLLLPYFLWVSFAGILNYLSIFK
jgi:tryptophan-rich sensory protein